MKKYRRKVDDDEQRWRPTRKKTRRWCKGKVGIEHNWGPEQVVWDNWATLGFRMWEKVCLSCGKRDWRTFRFERRDR